MPPTAEQTSPTSGTISKENGLVNAADSRSPPMTPSCGSRDVKESSSPPNCDKIEIEEASTSLTNPEGDDGKQKDGESGREEGVSEIPENQGEQTPPSTQGSASLAGKTSGVSSLVSLGFDPSRCEEALRACGGDIQKAADHLCKKTQADSTSSIKNNKEDTTLSADNSVTCNWEERARLYESEFKALLQTSDEALDLSQHSETKKELEDFHKQLAGFTEDKIPKGFFPLLAKLCQGKSATLTSMSKRVFQKLIPEDADTDISLLAIAEAIQIACERKSYGVRKAKIVQNEDEDPEARWRWESATIEFLPSDARSVLKGYRKDRRHKLKRINAYKKFFSLLSKKKRDNTKLATAAEKIVKFNREALVAEEKKASKLEKSRKRKAKTCNVAEILAKRTKLEQAQKAKEERERKKREKIEAQARKKAEQEKKRAEAKLKKEENKRKKEEAKRLKEEAKRLKEEMRRKEKEKKEATARKQAKTFANFFTIKPKAKKPVLKLTAGRFHKWQVPPNTTVAPILPYKTKLTIAEMDEQFFSGRPVKLPVFIRKRSKKRSGVKLLQFFEDVRPAWYGKHERTRSTKVDGRRPFARDPNLDYDYDSEAEWEDEPNDAEELRSDEDEPEEESSSSQKVRGDGLEEDGWLIAEDDPEYDGGTTDDTGNVIKTRIFGPIFDQDLSKLNEVGAFLLKFQGQPLGSTLPINCDIKNPIKDKKEVKKEKKNKRLSTGGKQKNSSGSDEEIKTIIKAVKEFSSKGRVKWSELFKKYQFANRSESWVKRRLYAYKKENPGDIPTGSPKSLSGKKSSAPLSSAKVKTSESKIVNNTPAQRKRKSTTPPDTKGRVKKRNTKKSNEPMKSTLTIKNLFMKLSKRTTMV